MIEIFFIKDTIAMNFISIWNFIILLKSLNVHSLLISMLELSIVHPIFFLYNTVYHIFTLQRKI